MEGSIRQAGAKIRIAVQLVDASTGAQVCGPKLMTAPSAPRSTLDLLDDVVPRIVSTVADTQGVLRAQHDRGAAQSGSRIAYTLRSVAAQLWISFACQCSRAPGREYGFGAAQCKQAPDRADCWACSSWLYREEYTHGFNLRPDPLGRVAGGGPAGCGRWRRPTTWRMPPWLRRCSSADELELFAAAAERAISLNPHGGIHHSLIMGMH